MSSTINKNETTQRQQHFFQTYTTLSKQLEELHQQHPSVSSPMKANILMKIAKHFESYNYKTHAMTAYQSCCKTCIRILFQAKHDNRKTIKYKDSVIKQVCETWTNAAFGNIIQIIELKKLIEAKEKYYEIEMKYNDIIVKRYHKNHPIWPFIVLGNNFLNANDGDTALYIFQKCIDHINNDNNQTTTTTTNVNNNNNNNNNKRNQQLGLAYTLAGDATYSCSNNNNNNHNKLRLGIKFYEKVIELNYKKADAFFGMANNLKALGKFENALIKYQLAIDEIEKDDEKSLPPSYIFNIAQSYEALTRYEDAIQLIDGTNNVFEEILVNMTQNFCNNSEIEEKNNNTLIDIYALQLFLLKLIFVGSNGMLQYLIRVPKLIEKINDFPLNVKLQLKKKLKTHWAYYIFLKSLYVNSKIPPTPFFQPKNLNKTFFLKCPVIGDSHVLSIAWQHVATTADNNINSKSNNDELQHKKIAFIPYNITGLMAWHIASSFTDKTTSSYTPMINLNIVLSKLTNENKGAMGQKCLFFCGEIDCRNTIYNAYKNKKNLKYETLDDAIEQTAKKYIHGMWELANKYGLEIYIVSVIPPTSNNNQQRARQLYHHHRRSIIVNKFNKFLNKYVQEKAEKGYSLIKYVDLYDEVIWKDNDNNDTHHDDSDNGCYFLQEKYKCDNIHANSNIIIPLHKILSNIGFY